MIFFCVFKQKTANDMLIIDWSSDGCSSDLAPITMRGLIEQGRLLNFRVFAPAHPDLSGVSVTGGDYNGKQLGDKMNDNALVADIVTTWAKLGEGRPTLCYCVDRAHAQK